MRGDRNQVICTALATGIMAQLLWSIDLCSASMPRVAHYNRLPYGDEPVTEVSSVVPS